MKKTIFGCLLAVGVLLIGLSLAPAHQPQLREDWVVGSTHNITWTTTGTVTSVKIEYTTDGGATWTLIAENEPNDGLYPWTIPNTPSTRCKVRMTITGAADPQYIGVSDASDGEWTISVVPTIKITSPNGGEVYPAGAIVPITWTSAGVAGPVKIEYSTNGGITYQTIVAATENTGMYMWTVPQKSGDRYVIRISQAFPKATSTGDIVL
jgi:hypothetical protein